MSDTETFEDAPKEEKATTFNVGEILEGKRETKKVERLVQATQFAKPKERLKVETGGGDKLGEIARINHNLGKTKAVQLKPLHKVLFDRPGAAASMKKNLRLFNGFPFQADSDLYTKKIKMLTKYPNSMLKSICQVLDIERSGTHIVLVERIMGFLMSPVNTGKPVPVKRKKKKRKNTGSDDKKKASKVAKSPKKATVEGKSKAIVTDSSSDDDDDDSDDEKPAAKDTKTSSAPESRKKKDSDDSSDEDEEEVDDDDDDDDDDEDEPPKSKPPAKKKPATPKKTASKKAAKTTPAKKKPVSKKVVKDDESGSSDKSDSDKSDNDDGSDFEKPKKKPAAKKQQAKQQAKPAPKTKKADSSSNKAAKKRQVLLDSEDSSDDDTPLIKMIKKPPTDEQIKSTVQDLLKDANLEEVTMKQLCQKVYDAYPEFDLASRKDYIKQTVKSLIS